MEVESSTYTDFISCDRAGRRNAVHDIQRDATTISMRKLTEDLGDLAVEGAGEQTPVSPAPGTQAGRDWKAADQSRLWEHHADAQEEHPLPHCIQSLRARWILS